MNSSQAKRFLAKKGATFFPGKGGHLIVTLNGRRAVLPQH
jgi:mRNA interferase HicA